MTDTHKPSRRAALLRIVRCSAALGMSGFLLGACGQLSARRDPERAMLGAGEVLLLDDLGETILPATPGLGGARAAAIGLYMLATVNECWPRKDAQAFVRGLDFLEAACASEHGRAFGALAPAEKLAFLTRLGADPASGQILPMLKRLTVSGYVTSELGATQALRYDPVPGSYRAIPYTKGDRRWATR